MNQSQFAKKIGVSRTAVTKMKKRGEIKFNADGTINEGETIEVLRGLGKIDELGKLIKGESVSMPTDEDAKALYVAKCETEKYRGLLLKTEYLKKTEQLIEVEKVEEVLFRAGRLMRDIFLASPKRNVPLLIGMNSAFEMEKLLEQDIINGLNEFIRVISNELDIDLHTGAE